MGSLSEMNKTVRIETATNIPKDQLIVLLRELRTEYSILYIRTGQVMVTHRVAGLLHEIDTILDQYHKDLMGNIRC